MKRIVLCFDGTWNRPDDVHPTETKVESNVPRFFRSIHSVGDDGIPQTAWYNAGVGTSWFNKLAGGAFGFGLDKHILDGYEELVKTYEDGDDVYILGFSRGAYTARSLVGLIRKCGLIHSGFASTGLSLMAYGIYRTRDGGPDSTVARAFRAMYSREIPIKFLGVWDTVGALGIPLDIPVVITLDRALYEFHDTELSGIVANAYQAIALDEHRVDYNVTLWDPKIKPLQTVEQRWFLGAHADVGGGYDDRRLSDITLQWMQDKAVGLGLSVDRVVAAPDSYKAAPVDSYGQFLDGAYAKLKGRPFFRTVLGTAFGDEILDPTIAQRRADATLSYAPANPGLPAVGP